MQVFVPYDAADPKTRLAGRLDDAERDRLARAMLADVLAAVEGAGHEPTVLSTGPVDCAVPVVVDDRPLTPAVNAVLADTTPAAVVMADLALATPAALDGLFAPDADVVLAPGLGGGTNALVARHPDFRVDYHGVSYRDHRERARAVGAGVETVDSLRLAVDLDGPGDLVDVLVHGGGRTVEALRAFGLTLTVTDGRPAVTRSGENGREGG